MVKIIRDHTVAIISPNDIKRPNKYIVTQEQSSPETLTVNIEAAIQQLISDGFDTFIVPAMCSIAIITLNALLKAKQSDTHIRIISAYTHLDKSHIIFPRYNPALDRLLDQVPDVIYMCENYKKKLFYSTKPNPYDTYFDEFLLAHSRAIIFDYTMYDQECTEVIEYNGKYPPMSVIRVQ